MNFKNTILTLILFVGLAISASAQAVVGNAGVIHTDADPNTVTKIQTMDERYNGMLAYDATNVKLWCYDDAGAAGSKWVSKDALITAFTYDAATGVLTITEAGNTTTATVAVMTGATGVADGEQGLVPKPVAGDEGKFLRGDGTWVTGGTESTTVTDGNTVDLTLTGSDITAEIDPDPNTENILTTSATGVLVDAPVDGVNNQVNGIDITLNATEQVEVALNPGELTAVTIDAADELIIGDASDGGNPKKITAADLIEGDISIIAGTATGFGIDTDADAAADIAIDAPLNGGIAITETTGANGVGTFKLGGLTAYDDHAAAGVGGVELNDYFECSDLNTMGCTPGAFIKRKF